MICEKCKGKMNWSIERASMMKSPRCSGTIKF